MRFRVRFERRAADANGDLIGAWRTLFETRARLQNIRGGETVMAERLEGNQPVIITIHWQSAAASLTTADRVVDARSGQIYDIKNITPDEWRKWVDVLATAKAGGTIG